MKPTATRIAFAAQSCLASAAEYADAALGRALARTESVHAQLFPQPLQRIESSESEDAFSLPAAALLSLNSICQVLTYECMLFSLFLQEMLTGLISQASSQKEALS